MVGEFKTMLFGHLILKFFDGVVFKFGNGSAVGANEVVMVVIAKGLKKGLPLAKLPLQSQPRLHKHQEGAIDGGITDGRILIAAFGQNFLNAIVPMRRGKKKIGDDFSLMGSLQSLFGQISLKGLQMIFLGRHFYIIN